MRIVVHGQQAFGKAVLEQLLERGEQVVAVCTAPDKSGGSVEPLKALALQAGLPVHQPASWKTEQAFALMQSFEADVCMMAYVLLFVPQSVIDAPRLGSFQYHPSLLPMHRGPSSINWPISMGATQTGLSIFWPNDGLDEGAVLLQKTCEIGADETLGEVYFNKLYPMGVAAMIESLDLVKRGNAPKLPQDLSQGCYQSWFGNPQAELDWTQSAQQVYNIIRAANPQPGAWTKHADSTLKIFDSRLGNGLGKPGEVITVGDQGFEVAAATGSIKIKRVRADAGKIAASDYAKQAAMRPGTILG